MGDFDLYDVVLAAMPDLDRGNNVPDWPEDERDLFRNGFPEHWQDFTTRAAAIHALRRRKAARLIADAVAAQIAQLTAERDRARTWAVRLEQELAEAERQRDGAFVDGALDALSEVERREINGDGPWWNPFVVGLRDDLRSGAWPEAGEPRG